MNGSPFIATLAIPLVPKMVMALGRQKYRIDKREPVPDKPGFMRLEAHYDREMKGTGRMPAGYTAEEIRGSRALAIARGEQALPPEPGPVPEGADKREVRRHKAAMNAHRTLVKQVQMYQQREYHEYTAIYMAYQDGKSAEQAAIDAEQAVAKAEQKAQADSQPKAPDVSERQRETMPAPEGMRIEPWGKKGVIVKGPAVTPAVMERVLPKYARTYDKRTGGWIFSAKRERALREALHHY